MARQKKVRDVLVATESEVAGRVEVEYVVEVEVVAPVVVKEPQVVVFYNDKEDCRFNLSELDNYCEYKRWHKQSVLDELARPYLNYLPGFKFTLQE